MEQNKNDSNQNPGKDKKPKNIWITILITVAIVLLITYVYSAISSSRYKEVDYSDFLTELDNNNLAEVEFQNDRVIYLTKTEAEKPADQQKACLTGLPNGDVT